MSCTSSQVACVWSNQVALCVVCGLTNVLVCGLTKMVVCGPAKMVVCGLTNVLVCGLWSNQGALCVVCGLTKLLCMWSRGENILLFLVQTVGRQLVEQRQYRPSRVRSTGPTARKHVNTAELGRYFPASYIVCMLLLHYIGLAAFFPGHPGYSGSRKVDFTGARDDGVTCIMAVK